MSENKSERAVDVIEEAANAFYDGYKSMPTRARKQLSIDVLVEIFRFMVCPAIDEVRRLDRGGTPKNRKPAHYTPNDPAHCDKCWAEASRQYIRGAKS